MSILIAVIIAIYLPACAVVDIVAYSYFQKLFVEKVVNQKKPTQRYIMAFFVVGFATATIQLGILIEAITWIIRWLHK